MLPPLNGVQIYCSLIASLCLLPFAQTTVRTIEGLSVNSVTVPLNATVSLKCPGGGFMGDLTWKGPSGDVLFPSSTALPPLEQHYRVDETATLTVVDITQQDAGFYWCSGAGTLVNATVWHVMIDPLFRFHLEIESITYGWYAGLGALVVGITVGIMKIIVKICCPQCHARASAAARVQQMRQLIVGLEEYRNDQSARLREHYNSQVDKLKESCSLQMEGLRDHYATKITRFRNYRLPFGTYRDQYWQQVSKVRDYSSVQMERLQDNYAKNLGKLRTYSVVQLERFRLQYQLQHKHMAKILEAMNFNIDSCRAGGPSGSAMTTSPDDGELNMEISLAHLQMNSGLNEYEESDSITVGPNDGAFVVQVDCIQENGPRSEQDATSADYTTPPTSSTPKAADETAGSSQGPDSKVLMGRLILVERVHDSADVVIHGDSPV